MFLPEIGGDKIINGIPAQEGEEDTSEEQQFECGHQYMNECKKYFHNRETIYRV
jgi:hypothetical protein